MRSIGRAAALVAVLGMPAIAFALARVSVSMWEGMNPASLADAGVALEDGLTLLSAAVGATIASYLALTGYAMLLGAVLRGGRAIPKALADVAPHGWTRVTATALGLTMSTGLAVPALAADGGSTRVPSAGWVAAPVSVTINPALAAVAVGWVEADAPAANPQSSDAQVQVYVHDQVLHDVPPLNTATSGAAPAEAEPTSASTRPTSAYVVQPGDSLWRITEGLLGADATAAQIAATWPKLYEANRDAIGNDPSLIHPGLALTVPAGLGS